ncbi:hypothetical protein AGMMS49925_05240 [Deltaproteobacteria bacterium]|nr:hypothetical protein AGMMS49925_05240 [Deltaproteobacteria bacterium]
MYNEHGHFFALNALPPEGREVTITDQSVWLTPLAAFHMACTVRRPLAATVHMLPAANGYLVRGALTGEVLLPCSRCAEDAVTAINACFEEFEETPALDAAGNPLPGEESRIVFHNNAPLLDLAALCWEEFVLALPPAPLCAPACRGVCLDCGVNLNTALCSCARDETDPRLAPLRALSLKSR